MKVLILRFSSIGDIVLTSPVIRCLHEQIPGVEIHFATKEKFASLLYADSRIAKVHLLRDSLTDLMKELKREGFDEVLDLHHNLRTFRIKMALSGRNKSFRKLNVQKWLYVRFGRNYMPNMHIVHRYMDTVKHLGVQYDDQGLDFFISPDTALPAEIVAELGADDYHVYAIGGTYFTKKLPTEKIQELVAASAVKLVLIGDNRDNLVGREVAAENPDKVLNLCGLLSISQSALLMAGAQKVIAHDTGMMHIAAALKKPVLSIWGNTVPEFGMWPLFPAALSEKNDLRFEVPALPCRPCSKLGHKACPKGHFLCMQGQNIAKIAEKLR